jgi:hypothetical protein
MHQPSGKTCWKIELFESFKHNWTFLSIWIDTKPHFFYFLFDFINSICLNEFD